MNQKLIGTFFKELRKEKGMTQEQLAEELNVSGRTVSRWETGSNMPDISLLLTIAEFFEVSIPEIINGKRKSEIMNEEVREVVENLATYTEAEKGLLLKRAKIVSIVGLISLTVGLIMEIISSETMIPIFDYVRGLCFGLAAGALITMVLYTTGNLAKMRKYKGKHTKIIAGVSLALLAVTLIASIVASFI